MAEVSTTEYIDLLSSNSADVFYYQVVAMNAKGESLPSVVVSVTKVVSAVSDASQVDELTIVQEINIEQTAAILTTPAQGLVNIRIFNVVGECVYTSQQNKAGDSLILPVSTLHLESGLYIITMQINDSEYVQKVKL